MVKVNSALILYFIALVIYIIAVMIDSDNLELFTKPIIIPSIYYYYYISVRRKIDYLFSFSMLSFFVGEILHLISKEEFYVPGLIFLLIPYFIVLFFLISDLIYYLKKRNTFGKMEMEIQDANGKKIVKLPVSNQKGINIVTWGFNEKGPKVAVGKTLDYSGFTTPLVPAGKYKAVLIKGKDKYTHEFEVLNDPKSPITAESRTEQRVATKMLFDKVQRLAYMVYGIDEMIKINNEITSKDKSYSRTSIKINSELNKLKINF